MKNPSPYIRSQLVTLLNGVINYDSQSVPCYEGEGEDVKYQIFLAEQNVAEKDTKHSFNSEFEQVIEVTSEQHTNLRKHVDIIGGEVMNLLKPTPTTKGVLSNTDFQITHLRKVSQNYLTENSGEGKYINRLILRYQIKITEK